MNNCGKLLIIPNEEEILQGVFERKVNSNRDCTNALINFCESNNYFMAIGIADIINEFAKIARLGHMVIKASDDHSSITLFLPIVISDEQYNYLYNNTLELQKYKNIEAYYLKKEDTKIERGMTDDINQLMLIANKKNSLYETKGMKK